MAVALTALAKQQHCDLLSIVYDATRLCREHYTQQLQLLHVPEQFHSSLVVAQANKNNNNNARAEFQDETENIRKTIVWLPVCAWDVDDDYIAPDDSMINDNGVDEQRPNTLARLQRRLFARLVLHIAHQRMFQVFETIFKHSVIPMQTPVISAEVRELLHKRLTATTSQTQRNTVVSTPFDLLLYGIRLAYVNDIQRGVGEYVLSDHFTTDMLSCNPMTVRANLSITRRNLICSILGPTQLSTNVDDQNLDLMNRRGRIRGKQQLAPLTMPGLLTRCLVQALRSHNYINMRHEHQGSPEDQQHTCCFAQSIFPLFEVAASSSVQQQPESKYDQQPSRTSKEYDQLSRFDRRNWMRMNMTNERGVPLSVSWFFQPNSITPSIRSLFASALEYAYALKPDGVFGILFITELFGIPCCLVTGRNNITERLHIPLPKPLTLGTILIFERVPLVEHAIHRAAYGITESLLIHDAALVNGGDVSRYDLRTRLTIATRCVMKPWQWFVKRHVWKRIEYGSYPYPLKQQARFIQPLQGAFEVVQSASLDRPDHVDTYTPLPLEDKWLRIEDACSWRDSVLYPSHHFDIRIKQFFAREHVKHLVLNVKPVVDYKTDEDGYIIVHTHAPLAVQPPNWNDHMARRFHATHLDTHRILFKTKRHQTVDLLLTACEWALDDSVEMYGGSVHVWWSVYAPVAHHVAQLVKQRRDGYRSVGGRQVDCTEWKTYDRPAFEEYVYEKNIYSVPEWMALIRPLLPDQFQSQPEANFETFDMQHQAAWNRFMAHWVNTRPILECRAEAHAETSRESLHGYVWIPTRDRSHDKSKPNGLSSVRGLLKSIESPTSLAVLLPEHIDKQDETRSDELRIDALGWMERVYNEMITTQKSQQQRQQQQQQQQYPLRHPSHLGILPWESPDPLPRMESTTRRQGHVLKTRARYWAPTLAPDGSNIGKAYDVDIAPS